MARINVEQRALADPRYDVLGQLLGSNRHEALGRMVLVWNECQERGRKTLSAQVIAAIFERDDAADLLVKAELAVRSNRPGHHRIKGTGSRTDWLQQRRKAGKQGGINSGIARRKARSKPEALASSQTNPPAPAPAPAPALEEKGAVGVKASPTVPTDGVAAAAHDPPDRPTDPDPDPDREPEPDQTETGYESRSTPELIDLRKQARYRIDQTADDGARSRLWAIVDAVTAELDRRHPRTPQDTRAP